ncbi:MAG: HEAT repeat domain-containing protein [Bryobacteraceae bacterium]
MLSNQAPGYANVIDPGMYSVDEAEQVALQLMADGQRIPERFALALQGEPPPDNGRAERMLELLPRIAPPERLLPLLDRIMPSSNTRIRSKAWKLYAAASADLGWALTQIDDGDARVAANVVEALWRAVPNEQLRELFLRAALQERNRVAGNGLVGLFSCNDPRGMEIARRLAKHEDAGFRSTVAWAIGHACWREGLELLEDLRRDKADKVRKIADRSLVRISRRHHGAACSLRPAEVSV